MKPVWLWGTNIVAVLPAFNEAEFIANLVQELTPHKKSGLIKEIIVVDDGSTDATTRRANLAGADKVIRLPENKGKASAVAAGVRDAAKRFKPEKTIVLMLDAEIEKVSRKQLEQLFRPIVRRKNRVDAVVGSNTYSRIFLSGQRAIRLSALGGLLRGTKQWKKMLRVGYALDPFVDNLIKNKERADTNFKVSDRPFIPGGRYHVLNEGVDAYTGYWYARTRAARLLGKARSEIKSKKMPDKEKRKEAMQAQLSIARRREKMAAGKMLRKTRRAKVKARQIKYRVKL